MFGRGGNCVDTITLAQGEYSKPSAAICLGFV